MKTCIILFAFVGASVALTPQEAVDNAFMEIETNRKMDFDVSRAKRKVTPRSILMAKRNTIVKDAVSQLTNSGYEAKEALKEVEKVLVETNREHEDCVKLPSSSCDSSSIYRTIDGSCNNLEHPSYGAAGVSFLRHVPANYDDGEQALTVTSNFNPSGRNCIKGGALPNVRSVSASVHPDVDIPSDVNALIVMQLGQFIDHDLTLAPESHIEDCCGSNTDEDCMPITVPADDAFYASHSVSCLELTRSTKSCSSSPREQFNDITGFLDASNVYGSTDEVASSIRSFSRGQLSVTTTSTGKELLPIIDDLYTAGDIRAEDMPGLAAMHTLFLREHNRLANIFADNGDSDEDAYQKARRVVGAEMQNIVFGQFLEAVIGEDMRKSDSSNYDSKVDPSITNEFATAAFRFGHTLIQGEISRLAVAPGAVNSSYLLKDNFFNPENYEADNGNGCEEIIHGVINQPAQTYDQNVVDDVTNFLFKEDEDDFGGDLVSRNLKRARDHGLATYGPMRSICNLKPLCNWNQRPDEISKSNWDVLKTLYVSPGDIELFTAGITENSAPGAIVGPTFQCIIREQFERLKAGDRFFFTHKNQKGSFSNKQINNIKTRTLSQVICDNTDITTVRSNIFRLKSKEFDCPAESTLNAMLFA